MVYYSYTPKPHVSSLEKFLEPPLLKTFGRFDASFDASHTYHLQPGVPHGEEHVTHGSSSVDSADPCTVHIQGDLRLRTTLLHVEHYGVHYAVFCQRGHRVRVRLESSILCDLQSNCNTRGTGFIKTYFISFIRSYENR